MADKVFVDTKVLVYSRDTSEPEKHIKAMEWMTHLWKMQTGRLSYQVLQEFYVTATEKLRPGLKFEDARRDVRSLLTWHPVAMEARVLEGAWVIQDQYKFSWWDALILSAAQAAECRYLLSEDLQENQELEDLRIINPFRTAPASL
jgi:predicted nucleic acid-binding protein